MDNGGVYSGATTATLTITGATVEMNGSRYRAVASNSVQANVTSNAATLTVRDEPPPGGSATLVVVGPSSYSPTGGKISLSASISYEESTPSAIGWSIVAPTGFSFSRIVSGEAPSVKPALGETGTLGFAYNSVPPGDGVSFVLELNYTAGLTGSLVITSTAYTGFSQSIPVAPITLLPVTPPSITTQPVNAVAMVGGRVTFTVVADGTNPLTYQWRKGGQTISGATAAEFAIDPVQVSSAGSYDVVVANQAGSVTSNSASLAVLDLVAGHEVAGLGYRAGGTVTINNTITYVGTLGSLGYSVLPPDPVNGVKWSHASSGGNLGSVKPGAGTTDLWEWAWSSVPESPIEFSYTLNVPAGTTGDQILTAMVLPRFSGVQLEALALPDPLTIPEMPSIHSADMNGDFKFSLIELLRVIELYNTRLGTTRTGRYAVASGSEDGFTADLVTPAGDPPSLSRYHSADFNRDSKISLIELLRVIELYNTREGTTRTGEYHVDPSTEDGFGPGRQP